MSNELMELATNYGWQVTRNKDFLGIRFLKDGEIIAEMANIKPFEATELANALARQVEIIKGDEQDE